jgi:hypothetical protein
LPPDASFDTLRSGTRRNHAAPAMSLAKTFLMIAVATLATPLFPRGDRGYLPTPIRANPAVLVFETANPRHAHHWATLAQMADTIPDDKILIPGVIDSTTKASSIRAPSPSAS